MNEPTSEEIKELWKRCGLVYKSFSREASNSCEAACIDPPLTGWYSAEGKLVSFKTVPNIDLNNLFKYAVPFLKDSNEEWLDVLVEWAKDITGNYGKDALALFWAIWESL